MGMNKRGLVLVLLLALFLAGCQNDNKEKTPEGPYVGGTQGLLFAFEEGEPPAAVLDNDQQEFFITLVVRNLGEYTVPEGKAIASISGIDSKAFSMSSLNTKNDVDITGIAKDQSFIIEGGEELLQFEQASYTNDVGADFGLTMRADLCYKYKTEALTHLCLKENVVKKEIEDVCDTTNSNLPHFNSGAPVQISNVRQNTVGSGKVQVAFTVENVGNGIVYLPESFTNACTGEKGMMDMVKISLENPQNNFKPSCSALGKSDSGNVRLVNRKKEITCTIDTSGLQKVSYQDLLLINVDYMYREAVTTNLNVENAV
ncbi:MAG: hypothetical protein Q8Q42_03430 [Nanoarchaeota archaeon]|nr:hypothetical protein [Nanoarchaeota archaeon]